MSLFAYDAAQGHAHVCGADEAGRGALAGPLVAAAVRLPAPAQPALVAALEGLNDSKQLTAKRRNALYAALRAQPLTVSVVIVSAAEIDTDGVAVCNVRALGQALDDVAGPGDLCLSDGFEAPGAPAPRRAVIGGDRTSAAVAAASIVAKVTRDRIMAALPYDQYGFAQHKGYGTRAHLQALERFGVTPVHRRSFAPVAQRVG